MRADVPLQVGVHDELLGAVGAAEVLAGGVRAHVELKVGRVREALVAVRALERPLTRVGAFVLKRRKEVFLNGSVWKNWLAL